eukprot:TRINITY_DN19673_c0_g1_i2.p1 TRINITY_DN19673_c0_g1~~TRINITY_DN19673_c0_g1_i2.p1  ORF type:complete len:108 (-),score=25.21 TRINITY_DN19673_c0_g1_i2:26-349(-)
MLRSLVGSEMCIRDSNNYSPKAGPYTAFREAQERLDTVRSRSMSVDDANTCLLYTSDAADEEDSVDLGGRRIIKKKKKRSSSNIRRNDLRLNKRTCRVIKTLRCIGQ